MKIDFAQGYEKWLDNVAKAQNKIKDIKAKKSASKWQRYYKAHKEELNAKKKDYHKNNHDAYKKSLNKWYENLKKNPQKYAKYIAKISENRRRRKNTILSSTTQES
ncbi:MAG: hypothetical protein MJZ26_11190 [Fibrobacter sp.]|nr:hypothetical protein [Fibrobacter sp.]